MLSSGVSQKPLMRYLSTEISPGRLTSSSTTAADGLSFSSTRAPVPGIGSPIPTDLPSGLKQCSTPGARLRRSGRLPQLSQMIGTSTSRSAGISACNGAIGARSGARSAPRLSTQPPGAQKSFCISTTMIAVRVRSTVMFCGSAWMVTLRGAASGGARSTCLGLTSHVWRPVPRANPAEPRSATVSALLIPPPPLRRQSVSQPLCGLRDLQAACQTPVAQRAAPRLQSCLEGRQFSAALTVFAASLPALSALADNATVKAAAGRVDARSSDK